MGNHYSRLQGWLPIVLVLMLFACGGGGSDDDDRGVTGADNEVATANRSVPENVFTATLEAAQAAPANGSNATGIGIVMVDPTNRMMRVSLTTAGITGTSATISLAPAGTAGVAVFPLIEMPAGSGLWSGQTTLTAQQFSALRNGNYYFDVRSLAFPEGEIRGQILARLPASGTANAVNVNTIDSADFSNGGLVTGNGGLSSPSNPVGAIPASGMTGTAGSPGGLGTPNSVGTVGFPDDTSQSFAVAQRTTFVNVLTGSQQVPSNASRAVAIGVLIVNPFERTMTASITSLGITGLGAHIHQAAAGSTGDVVVALNETSAGSGIWGARIPMSETQFDAITNGTYYFDIHTSAFPNGELRGQIVGSGGAGGARTGLSDGNANAQPLTSRRDTAGTGDVPTTATGGGVPSISNPAGSGIGSGVGTGFTAGVPSLGNPAGAGIGSAESADFADSSAFGSGAGSDSSLF